MSESCRRPPTIARRPVRPPRRTDTVLLGTLARALRDLRGDTRPTATPARTRPAACRARGRERSGQPGSPPGVRTDRALLGQTVPWSIACFVVSRDRRGSGIAGGCRAPRRRRGRRSTHRPGIRARRACPGHSATWGPLHVRAGWLVSRPGDLGQRRRAPSRHAPRRLRRTSPSAARTKPHLVPRRDQPAPAHHGSKRPDAWAPMELRLTAPGA
jgi:hypothetical protein